jgi:lipoprotein-releasing system ATP-binding protein
MSEVLAKEVVLSAQDLHKRFHEGPLDVHVLQGVNISVNAGETLAVVGASGSGKSTLLHLLGTLDRPSAGRIQLDGQDLFALGERELARFRNHAIGFVFQDHHLLPQCSVLENVLVPTLADRTGDRSALEQRARHLLERVGLSERLDHRPAELSGGERQRVALARALILKPKLLLADEPTGNLDRKTAHAVGELLLELHRQEQTILIVVTHSVELARMLPRQMEMNDGNLVPWSGGRP